MFKRKTALIDSCTPESRSFCGLFTKSYANYTIAERIPILLTKLIDYFSRNQGQHEFGQNYNKEFNDFVKSIVELKHNIITDKKLITFHDKIECANIWNNFVNNSEKTFFNEVAVLVECYIYRKIFEATEISLLNLKDFDPFEFLKLDFFKKSLNIVDQIFEQFPIINRNDEESFTFFLKLSTWSSLYDYEFWINKTIPENFFKNFDSTRTLLIDDCSYIWRFLNEQHMNKSLNIICNNFGLESIADFILADFLMSQNYCEKINFYPKKIPWNLSDCTETDLTKLIQILTTYYTNNSVISEIINRWRQYFSNGSWQIISNHCWTLPNFYEDSLKELNLNEHMLTIFKGDYHYRKIFKDINWPWDTNIKTVLNNEIKSCNFCCLRVIKSELICGLGEQSVLTHENILDNLGNFAIIQLHISND